MEWMMNKTPDVSNYLELVSKHDKVEKSLNCLCFLSGQPCHRYQRSLQSSSSGPLSVCRFSGNLLLLFITIIVGYVWFNQPFVCLFLYVPCGPYLLPYLFLQLTKLRELDKQNHSQVDLQRGKHRKLSSVEKPCWWLQRLYHRYLSVIV